MEYYDEKVCITSMYANPIHPGHLDVLSGCFQLAPCNVFVIVNNDKQQLLKTGKIFQDEEFRLKIVESLKPVKKAYLSIDEDTSVCKSIEMLHRNLIDFYNPRTVKFYFGKGGDRTIDNIPEKEICEKLGIEIVDGLGLKTYNSSDYRK